MPYEIEWQALPEQPTLAQRAKLPAEQLSTWLPQAFAELFDYLEKQGVSPAGPPYARYEMNGEIVVEAGVPVVDPVVGQGPIITSALPAGTVATALHVGPYDEVTEPYEALQRWIIEHDYEPTGQYWEVYLTDPAETPDPAKQQTVLFMQYR